MSAWSGCCRTLTQSARSARLVAGNVRRRAVHRPPTWIQTPVIAFKDDRGLGDRQAVQQTTTRQLSTSKASETEVLGAAASTSTASFPSEASSVHSSLAALKTFFASNPTSAAYDAEWDAIVSDALQMASSSSSAPRQVLLLRWDQREPQSLLDSLLEDALVDPEGQIPSLMHGIRQADTEEDLLVQYGDTLMWNEIDRILSAPLPWLALSNGRIQEMRVPDAPFDEVVSSIARRMYLAQQVILPIPYSALFDPDQSAKLAAIRSLLGRFKSHPGLQVVVTTSDSSRIGPRAQEAAREIVFRGAAKGAASLDVTFKDLTKAAEAQATLRGTLGSPQTESQGVGAQSEPQTRGQTGSVEWSRFQALSADSGLPDLINTISTSPITRSNTDLLISHAKDAISMRLQRAQDEWEHYRQGSEFLSRCPDRLAAVQQELLDIAKEVTDRKLPALGQEPGLLPPWWKLPLLGPEETRQRIHDALHRDWLGGEETQTRLVRTTGKLQELQSLEIDAVNAALRRLELDDSLSTPESRGAGDSATEIVTSQKRSRLVMIPPSVRLDIRAALPSNHTSHRADFSNPHLLTSGLEAIRSHFFARGGQGSLPLIGGGKGGQLDKLQYALQVHLYTFWLLLGGIWAFAGLGYLRWTFSPPTGGDATSTSASEMNVDDETTKKSTSAKDGVSTPISSSSSSSSSSSTASSSSSSSSLSPSTYLSLSLLATLLLVRRLQTFHRRTTRLLLRSVRSRIPVDARADLEGRIREDVMQKGLLAYRGRVSALLGRWSDVGRGRVEEQKREWRRVLQAINHA